MVFKALLLLLIGVIVFLPAHAETADTNELPSSFVPVADVLVCAESTDEVVEFIAAFVREDFLAQSSLTCSLLPKEDVYVFGRELNIVFEVFSTDLCEEVRCTDTFVVGVYQAVAYDRSSRVGYNVHALGPEPIVFGSMHVKKGFLADVEYHRVPSPSADPHPPSPSTRELCISCEVSTIEYAALVIQ